MAGPGYIELQVTSNFSFLRGASHAEELVVAAQALGHAGIGIADRNTLAGAARMFVAARDHGFPMRLGTRIDLRDGRSILCYPLDRAGYGRLSRLLTLGRTRAPKGECHLDLDDLLAHAEGQVLIALPDTIADPEALLPQLREAAGDRLYLAAHHLYRGDDAARLDRLADMARRHGVPLVATNDVHFHAPERRVLQDVLTCIREGCTIDEAGLRLFAHAERHLKPAAEMARLFAGHEDALARTLEIAERCSFRLDELRYEYPLEILTPGETAQETLERLTWAAAAIHPKGITDRIRDTLDKELELIAARGYAPFFLTVHQIVNKARELNILCQGRGSAANSAVCFYLGVTALDPHETELLFERFISAARDEAPDIDVDFEHARREEIIQWIYDFYGRHRAGLAATVVRYRSRGAIRDVGKALGLSRDTIAALSGTVWGWHGNGIPPEEARRLGLDPDEPRLALALKLSAELTGFPRHLSQHVGGFVLARDRLDELVPIENATMKDRTVIEWDKDDIEALGLLKVDVLALGMLTCLHRGLDLIHAHHGQDFRLDTIPKDKSEVYEMLGHADTIGVFQVESRAQMSMLPRLKPKNLYDLVIEVAIVRPGPIQGDMVHPYLRRRDGLERPDIPKGLEGVLVKTLGVPLFQEQAMQIAMVAAGFSGAKADRLRRSMATFRNDGQVSQFRIEMIEGMVSRGYDRGFAERCFKQIEGFGSYGFPESHAASFAKLVYVSAWMKCFYPAAFACSLLNSQPMGFYAPSQIVQDAIAHDVQVLPVDVNLSTWDCTLEPAGAAGSRRWRDPMALRLGFRMIRGLPEPVADKIVRHRGNGYGDPAVLWRRARIERVHLEKLAAADAFRSTGQDRRGALWAIRRLGDHPLPLFARIEGENDDEPAVILPEMPLRTHVVHDHVMTGISLKRHPVAFLRPVLAREGILPTRELKALRPGGRVHVTGLVLVRQRPGSASGVIFCTLEDETGIANAVIWPKVFETCRRDLLGARLLEVVGTLQREGEVIHVIAERLIDRSALLHGLTEEPAMDDADRVRSGARALPVRSRDFH